MQGQFPYRVERERESGVETSDRETIKRELSPTLITRDAKSARDDRKHTRDRDTSQKRWHRPTKSRDQCTTPSVAPRTCLKLGPVKAPFPPPKVSPTRPARFAYLVRYSWTMLSLSLSLSIYLSLSLALSLSLSRSLSLSFSLSLSLALTLLGERSAKERSVKERRASSRAHDAREHAEIDGKLPLRATRLHLLHKRRKGATLSFRSTHRAFRNAQ